MDLDTPKVMGILNVTPDSFYEGSRTLSYDSICERVARIASEGADIIDVGGCSTRPGAAFPSPEEEWERVESGCKAVRDNNPDFPLSVDTFRAEVASRAIDKWGADIINDVSGCSDPVMADVVADKRVAYVLTHNAGIESSENVTARVLTELSWKLHDLRLKGINDIIVDPGFGFGKTTQQNFELFAHLEEIVRMDCPVLVGVSRKSMIYKTLGIGPEESFTGTVALNAVALEKGASILRVHDVKAAKETCRLIERVKGNR